MPGEGAPSSHLGLAGIDPPIAEGYESGRSPHDGDKASPGDRGESGLKWFGRED